MASFTDLSEGNLPGKIWDLGFRICPVRFGIVFEWRGKFVASVGDLSEGNLLSKKRRHEAERANQPVGESGRNRKGIFLRDMQYKKPKALYIFFASIQLEEI